MTRREFVEIAAYIGSVTKPLNDQSLEVYFDLLGDLDAAVLRQAARVVLISHRYPSFPSVAELREAAMMVRNGATSDLTPADAWELASRAASKIDPEVDGSMERHTKNLPPLVVRTMTAFGIASLCHGQVAVIRGQFLKMFEQLAERSKHEAILPERDRLAIEQRKPAIGAARTIVQSIADVFQAGEKR